MIKLHQYPAVWGLPSLSPFCIKVEMVLRKKKFPYQIVVERNPAKGPKGKMPFIQDGSLVISDSTFILQHLKFENIDAQSVAFQRLIEEHLYFVLLYSRWIDPCGFKVVQNEFKDLFPPFLGKPILSLLRHRLKRQALAQGIGRHSAEQVYEIGRRDIKALSNFLGNKTYFLGNEFGALDASAYAFLITILKQPIESPLKIEVLAHRNLIDYCNREESQVFPEFFKTTRSSCEP